jgi:hypothetical protein
MDLLIREIRRKGRGKMIILFPLHICARTLPTIVTIETLIVTLNKNVGSYIQC